MSAPAGPSFRRTKAFSVLALVLLATVLLALAAPVALAGTGTSASASPAATGDDQAFVNWTWLVIGLGIPLAGLVVFYLIRRGGGRSGIG